MRKVSSFVVITFLILSLSSLGFAQRQTGAIDGKAVDNEGLPLPGVVVTLSGPALMGTQAYTTSDSGDFRFPSVPPGQEYSITVELPGFKTLKRGGIIVRVGKTVTLIITMEEAALEEEVTVVAATPTIDVKASKVSVSYTRELLNNIPMARNVYDVVKSAPGAVSEGGVAISVHGSPVSDNRYALDGVDMTDPMINFPLANISFDMFEEVEMETGAHPAYIGNVSGVYVNIVTPSGGNEFHGQGTFYYFNESLVDRNFTDEQLDALGVASPAMDRKATDGSFNLGGPVFKDKLWFFLSGRYYGYDRLVTGFPEVYSQREYFGFGKLTYQLTRNIKLMAYFNYSNNHVPYSGADPTVSVDATADYDDNTKAFNAQLNWIINQNAFVDVRGMWARRYYTYQQKPGTTTQTYDIATGLTTGASRFSEDWNWGRYKFNPNLTLFLEDVLGGDHELKIGAEYEKPFADADFWMNQPYWLYLRSGTPYYFGGNMGLIFTLGFGPNKRETETFVDFYQLAFYVQDSWTIQDRVTLNLGLRYATAHANLPAQVSEEVTYWMWLDPDYFRRKEYPEYKDIIVFNTLSPRLGLTFDIFGTGKSIFKVSYGRYFDYLQGTFFWYSNPNGYAWQQWLWMDLNLNGEWDPADYFLKFYESGRQDYDPSEQYDPDLRCPYWDEFIIGLDHELIPDLRLGISFKYKRHGDVFQNIEKNRDQNWASTFTVTDPGYDGTVGTADDSQLTVYDRTGPFEMIYHTNVPEAFMKYRGVELVFEKRMSNRWQLFGSIVYSKMWGTVGAAHVESYGGGSPFDTPNWMINRDGRLDFDRPLLVKMQGTYQLPYGFLLSGNFIHSSGTPFTRQLSVFLPNHGSTATINAETQGSRRNPSWNRLDLRLEKEITIGDVGKLGLFLDVYNTFNSADIYVRAGYQGQIEADGSFTEYPLWQTVSSVSLPRRIKLGLRFTF